MMPVKRDVLTKILWPVVRFFLVWAAYTFGINWLVVSGCQINGRTDQPVRDLAWTLALIIGFIASLQYWANARNEGSKRGTSVK